MYDSKLLQGSNLTAGARLCHASNLTRSAKQSEGLVKVRGIPVWASFTGRELGTLAPTHQMLPTTLRTLPSDDLYRFTSVSSFNEDYNDFGRYLNQLQHSGCAYGTKHQRISALTPGHKK